jgi:ribosomal protein S12 methylthiotransferase accessory factor
MRRTHIELNDAYKGTTLDQDKVIDPQETVARFRERLAALDLDILAKAERIDNGRLDIPVYFSLCGKDAQTLTGTKKQMGKGATPQQAEASAVMELAERFSFFSWYNEAGNFKTAPFAAVQDKALAYDQIVRSVHDEADEGERARPFFEQLPLKWASTWSLVQNREVWVPINWFFAINEFNGPSAGNCLEEALLQGISEVVERDVSARVNHGRLNVPGIDPESVKDPVVRNLIAKYRRAGIDLYLSDFTLGMGIPTVGVLAHDPATFPEKSEIVWTAGTTPDPQKALSRALTETAQLGGDFNSGSNYVASGLPKFGDMAAASFITAPPKMISIFDLPDLSNDNMKIEVENYIGALSGRGYDIFCADASHPELQVPALYTIIPGAHFRERAQGTSVALFTAKLITETLPVPAALRLLGEMDQALDGKYFLRFYQGQCEIELGHFETALARLKTALELSPKAEDLASIYAYMGICHKEMAQYEAALEVLEKGAAHDDERTDIFNLMGFCHFKLKAFDKAIACFERILQLDPSSAIDYANIGSNYREMGQTEKAIAFYELALDLDPQIDFARESLARLKAGQHPSG